MLNLDSGELLSSGLPDSSQPIKIVIVEDVVVIIMIIIKVVIVMMTAKWLEAHMKENNRHEAPTKEQYLAMFQHFQQINFACLSYIVYCNG